MLWLCSAAPSFCFWRQNAQERETQIRRRREKSVLCGMRIKPAPGTTRYSRGSHITVQKKHFVICIHCGIFDEGFHLGGRNTSECKSCGEDREAAIMDIYRRRDEAYNEQQERDRLMTMHVTRQARRQVLYPSDSDSTELSRSPTFGELQFQMVQAEAF